METNAPRSPRFVNVLGREPVNSFSSSNSSRRFDRFPISAHIVPVNLFEANFKLAARNKTIEGRSVRIQCCSIDNAKPHSATYSRK